MADTVELSSVGSNEATLLGRRGGQVALLLSSSVRAVTTSQTISTTFRGMSIGDGATLTLTGGTGSFQGVLVDPTVVYDAPLAFTGGRSYDEQAILTNPAGVAKSLPHQTGYNASAIMQADGAAVTWSRTEFLGNTSLTRINAGTLTLDTLTTIEVAGTIDTGCTATVKRGVWVKDPSGSGTITTALGIDIEPLAKGSTIIGIRNGSTMVGTPSVATLAAVGNTITANALVKRLNNTSGGSLTLTSNPHITDGQDGQLLILFNSSANDVVLTDGNGVQLGAATRTLGTRDTLMLMYSTDIGDWIELGFVSN